MSYRVMLLRPSAPALASSPPLPTSLPPQIRELARVHPEACTPHLGPLVDLVAAAALNNFEGSPKLRETVWRCLPDLAKAIGGWRACCRGKGHRWGGGAAGDRARRGHHACCGAGGRAKAAGAGAAWLLAVWPAFSKPQACRLRQNPLGDLPWSQCHGASVIPAPLAPPAGKQALKRHLLEGLLRPLFDDLTCGSQLTEVAAGVRGRWWAWQWGCMHACLKRDCTRRLTHASALHMPQPCLSPA